MQDGLRCVDVSLLFSMWPWIAQNKEWVFSGAGIAVFAGLWWLFKKLFSSPPAATTVTQAPIVTVSPTFNLSQTSLAPENTKTEFVTAAPMRSAEEAEAARPTLYSLPPRIWFVRECEAYGFTQGGDASRAAVATFRMAKPGADRRGTHITARLSYRTKSDADLGGISKEIGRVNYGAWIDQDFNSATFTLTDTHELILVWKENGNFVAVQDNRHSISKFKEPSYYELAEHEFFVNVTLVDEIYGSLITYTYKVETNPFKVSEIIRFPRA